MIDSDPLRLMIYQHVVQLTVAGEDVPRACAIAYDVARIVTDDDLHDRCVEAAIKRMQRRAAAQAADGAEPAKVHKKSPVAAASETVVSVGGPPAATPKDKRPKS